MWNALCNGTSCRLAAPAPARMVSFPVQDGAFHRFCSELVRVRESAKLFSPLFPARRLQAAALWATTLALLHDEGMSGLK
jgi:hypothetical protein